MFTISVVTICFNNLDDVIATCASVDSQNLKPYEHWIINGSTNDKDEISQWLEKNEQPIYRKWVKITNQHIAGNFSRGIENATGDFIHLLNSGDLYASVDVLSKVSNFLEEHPKIQWVSGKLRTIRGGEMIEIGKPFESKKLYRGMRSVSHPTWFVYKDVYSKHGLYNTKYRIAMDYDMMCRIVSEPYAFMNFTIAYFDNTGISSVKYIDSLKDNIEVYESHFGYSLKCRIWQFRLKLLHYLLSTGLGKWLFGIKLKLGMGNV